MNTSDILNTAADLIQKRGWVTGTGWNENDSEPLCLEGGIQAAAGITYSEDGYGEFRSCPAYMAVREYLGQHNPHSFLYDFNDAYGRTAAEVIEVLRACAVIEASRERVSAGVRA